MSALLLGIACGALEYALLQVLVCRSIRLKKVSLWIPLAKFLLLPLFLLPVAITEPDRLHIAGIAAAGVLVATSIIRFLLTQRKKPTLGDVHA